MPSARPGGQNRDGPADDGVSVLAALARLPALRELPPAAIRCIMAFRFLAACSSTGRDPVPDLILRLRNVEAAQAFLSFADHAGAVWPSRILVCRPCCYGLSIDEITIAQVLEAARHGDRDGFSRQLDGFVRLDRHARLFDRAVAAAIALQA